jgi:conjugal transfer pilus assembly protein TrbC
VIALAATIALTTSAAEDPAKLAEQAKRNAAAVQLDVTPAQFTDMQRVERAAEAGTARGIGELERQAAERRARTEVTVTISADGSQVAGNPDTDELQVADQPVLAGRLVVAISTSMPEAMVREYARQLDGMPEAILVLRGFLGGARAVTPTVQWIERALRKRPTDPDGGHYRVEVVVDPLAYRMLGIDKVPAITFLPGVQDLRHCDAQELRASSIAYGAVSVAGALASLGKSITVPASLLAKLGR